MLFCSYVFSKTKIPLAQCNFLDILHCFGSDFRMWHALYFCCNEFLYLCAHLCRRIVLRILFQCHQCVWLTAIGYLSTLCQRHKSVACASFAVTRCAEAWYIPQIQQPRHHFVQRTLVRHVKLCCFVMAFFFGISTY